MRGGVALWWLLEIQELISSQRGNLENEGSKNIREDLKGDVGSINCWESVTENGGSIGIEAKGARDACLAGRAPRGLAASLELQV